MKKIQQKYYIIAFIISLSGLSLDSIYLLESGLDVVVWHASQYIFGFLLAFVFGFKNGIWGLSLMLFVDGWLLVEGIAGIKSNILMMFAFLSAFKILFLFPAGIALGYIFRKKFWGRNA